MVSFWSYENSLGSNNTLMKGWRYLDSQVGQALTDKCRQGRGVRAQYKASEGGVLIQGFFPYSLLLAYPNTYTALYQTCVTNRNSPRLQSRASWTTRGYEHSVASAIDPSATWRLSALDRDSFRPPHAIPFSSCCHNSSLSTTYCIWDASP